MHLREIVKIDQNSTTRYYWIAFTRADLFEALFSRIMEESKQQIRKYKICKKKDQKIISSTNENITY